MPFNYNVSPAPTSGANAFGLVPGQVGLPSPFDDLAGAYPNLSKTNSQVSQNIMSKLNGEISPATLRALQGSAAQHGVASGMPGMQPGSMNLNSLFGNIAGYTENLQQQGTTDYNATIPTVSKTQTVSPETQISLAEMNAINRAAPDPTAAATYAMQLFDKYLASMSRGGGGGARGGGGGGGGGRPSGWGGMATPPPAPGTEGSGTFGPPVSAQGTAGPNGAPYLGPAPGSYGSETDIYGNPIGVINEYGASGSGVDMWGGADANPWDQVPTVDLGNSGDLFKFLGGP